MIEIAPTFQAFFADLGLTSCEAVVHFFITGLILPAEEKVIVTSQMLPPRAGTSSAVFYKQYEYPHPAWRYIGRRSKARCEFANYAAFRQLGIRTPTAIACGEERSATGALRRAFIITTAVPHAWGLAQFLTEHCPNRANAAHRQLRDSLRRQLAAMTRTIHAAGFFHRDLVWRNILVTWQPPAEPQLWWIDCPRGGFVKSGFRRARHPIKDLASLDKSAHLACRPGERLAFIREYLGKSRLDASAKALVRATTTYRQKRWPEDCA